MKTDISFAVAELNGSLDLKCKYIYTNGMLVGRIDSSGEFYQYFHDELGSITMICDSTGSYQNLYTYDDFGDFRSKSENVSNSYCYTGQERDEEPSGLYNLRARYYAAGIGRFTQEDPLMAVLDVNRIQEFNGYCYVANNPVNFIDPFGLCKQKQEDCRKVFLDCMVDKLIAPGWSSFTMAAGEGGGYFFMTKAWQYAVAKGLTYPLKSSIFRSKMLWSKSFGPVVILATIIFVEEYCIFKEIECLQEQAYEIQEKTYGGCK